MPRKISQANSHTECVLVKSDKHTVRKRFSKFLLKILRNMNQAAPNYSSSNYCGSTSVDKDVLNIQNHEQSIIDTKLNQIQGATQYRRRSILTRNSTLTSIKEENEIELISCT